MNLFLTGASGLLGNACARAAVDRGHQVTALVHRSPPVASGLAATVAIDPSQADALDTLCRKLRPDAIINCAAVTSPAAVDADPPAAESANIALPRQLALISSDLGTRLLHLSTDMVFDGRSKLPYCPHDAPNPTIRYAETKLRAEREVMTHNPQNSLILRIPILTGNSPRGNHSVHETLLEALAGGRRPSLFRDEFRRPCSATSVAAVLLALAERPDLHGVFHWTGADTLSRLEIGRRILSHFGLPLQLVTGGSQQDNPAFSIRPASLALDPAPLVDEIGIQPPTFTSQLQDLEIPASLESWFRKTRQGAANAEPTE